MPKGNAEFFEVLVCQVGQNGSIDIVLGKALRVLPETELFEPVRNLLHHGSPGCRALPPASESLPDDNATQ